MCRQADFPTFLQLISLGRLLGQKPPLTHRVIGVTIVTLRHIFDKFTLRIKRMAGFGLFICFFCHFLPRMAPYD